VAEVHSIALRSLTLSLLAPRCKGIGASKSILGAGMKHLDAVRYAQIRQSPPLRHLLAVGNS